MSKPDIIRLVDLVISIKRAGITILLIEHHQDVIAELCDLVTVMDGGQLIAQGTPEQVRRNKKVIEAYLGSDETATQAKSEMRTQLC